MARRYAALPPYLQTAFRQLTEHGYEAISVTEAARIMGTSEFAAEGFLEQLVEFRLVEVAPPVETQAESGFQFWFHSLIRSAASGLQDDGQGRYSTTQLAPARSALRAVQPVSHPA